MYINPKLKLNKFRAVRCKTKKELFSMVGNVAQNVDAFTGDEISAMAQNKTEEYADTSTMIKHTISQKQKEEATEEN